jgi:hypothetical protein
MVRPPQAITITIMISNNIECGAALNASVRDIAEGNVHDAQNVQAEASRMLADHRRSRPAATGPSPKPARRTRTV